MDRPKLQSELEIRAERRFMDNDAHEIGMAVAVAFTTLSFLLPGYSKISRISLQLKVVDQGRIDTINDLTLSPMAL